MNQVVEKSAGADRDHRLMPHQHHDRARLGAPKMRADPIDMSLYSVEKTPRRLLRSGARTDERDALLDTVKRVVIHGHGRISHRLEHADLAPARRKSRPDDEIWAERRDRLDVGRKKCADLWQPRSRRRIVAIL